MEAGTLPKNDEDDNESETRDESATNAGNPPLPDLVSDSEESSSEDGNELLEEEVVNFLKNLPHTDVRRRLRISQHLKSVKRIVFCVSPKPTQSFHL